MASAVTLKNLQYELPNRRRILSGIEFELEEGKFLAALGENGAGKTTLLDLLMGFRKRTGGEMKVLAEDPHNDPWESRLRIAYLSEKVDIPGDWDASEFLAFHRHFYPRYDKSRENKFAELFRISGNERAGNLSAGELRRLQIIGALAARPDLVIADEITAVLDILGRRKFLQILQDEQKERGMTVILATNIPEGLEGYADQILLLRQGHQTAFSRMAEFVSDGRDFGNEVARRLETL